MHIGFIELWRPHKAGLYKQEHTHTNNALQVNEIKHKTEESYVARETIGSIKSQKKKKWISDTGG